MSRHSSNEDVKKVAVPGLFSSKMPAREKQREDRERETEKKEHGQSPRRKCHQKGARGRGDRKDHGLSPRHKCHQKGARGQEDGTATTRTRECQCSKDVEVRR